MLRRTDRSVTRVSKENVVEESRDCDTVVDPAVRAALEDAGVSLESIADKRRSYRSLLDAGVDESVATALRRQFSLPWSFEADGDLDRRSSEVRGLGEREREWVAASATEDWQAFDAARTRVEDDESEAPKERPYPRPTPVATVTGVSPENAERLAEAGVISAERLATIDAGEVAKVLELDVLHVRLWRYNARELLR